MEQQGYALGSTGNPGTNGGTNAPSMPMQQQYNSGAGYVRGNSVTLDIKKLNRFFSEDKAPRKRLSNALEFLKNASLEQQDLFWDDPGYGSTFFSALQGYVTELETLYVLPDSGSGQPNLLARMRKKTFAPEDWTEVFEGLEMLIKNNKQLIVQGWQYMRFQQILHKLLLAENFPHIKKYAFR